MKPFFYIVSWLISLFLGMIFSGIYTGEPMFGILYALVSLVVSAPFITIFSIVMMLYLKKQPSTRALHLRTFTLHLSGSILTVVLLTLMVNEIIPFAIYGGILAYFVVDSILFHSFIELKHPTKQPSVKTSEDILDSPL